MGEKKLISIGQAADALSVSKDTIRRLIARQQIKSVNVLRRVMIPVAELERLTQPR
jgi:excisionase family DNA binding protein